ACFPEPVQVLLHLIGIHDVESPLTSVETVLDERSKDPVLFLDAVEEGADVTVLTENAPCKLDGLLARSHGSPRNRGMILLSNRDSVSSGSFRSRDDSEAHRHPILDLDQSGRGGRRLDPDIGLLQDELAVARAHVVLQV